MVQDLEDYGKKYLTITQNIVFLLVNQENILKIRFRFLCSHFWDGEMITFCVCTFSAINYYAPKDDQF